MQQVQSEQDKMVPIDTSGESVEIELKEDKAVETANNKQEEIVVEEQDQGTKMKMSLISILNQ